MRLWHWCCHHSADDIERDGLIKPTWVTWSKLDAMLAENGWPPTGLAGAPTVAWFTDDPEAHPHDLGLDPRPGVCDRTEARFTVETMATPWPTFALLHRANPAWRTQLEMGRRVERWFVVTEPVPYTEVDRWD